MKKNGKLITVSRPQKSGQIDQVFLYIMAIIVIGAIVLIGYNAIENLIKDQCNVEQTRFQTNIDRAIRENRESGSAETVKIDVPCDYEEICIAGENINDEEINNIEDQTIRTEIRAKTGQNIFLKKQKETVPVMAAEGIQVENPETPGYICIKPKSNIFYIRMESQGYNKIKISQGN